MAYDFKIKVGAIGIADILKFLNMTKVREKTINSAPAKEVKGDFTINKKAKSLHPDCQKMTVSEIIEHPESGAKTFILKNKDNTGAAFFRAGQYLSIQMQIGDSLLTRPYSISSSPAWAKEGKYAVTVRKTNGGFASDYLLENVNVGDELNVSDPQGTFYYEDLRDPENIIALAGGSGITPFLSMAYAIRDKIENFNLTIIYGSKTEESILFKKELDEICAVCKKVKVVHVLSDETKNGYENGFITAELIKKYAPENYSIFICGPEAMYRFVAKETEKLALPAKNVRREMLGVTKKVAEEPGYPAEAKDKVFKLKVNQCGTIYEIEAKADEPMLVALERAGINAPSRCRSGECGWCRSKLISGNVFCPKENEYRRWADKENGYVHPCCTFLLSDAEIEAPGSYIK